MPILPEFQQSNQLASSPDVVNVQPGRFGKDAEAMAGLGGAIGEFGSELLKIRKKAEEADFTWNAHKEDIEWLQKKEEELRLSYSKKDENGNPRIKENGMLDYDPRGFADALKEATEKRFVEKMDSAPTGDAQRMYRARSGEMFNQAYEKAYQWEKIETVKTYERNFNEGVGELLQSLVNDPSPSNLRTTIGATAKKLNDDLAIKNISPGQADEYFKKVGHDGSMVLFDSLGDTEEGRAIALNLIKNIKPFEDPFGSQIQMGGKTGPQDAPETFNQIKLPDGSVKPQISFADFGSDTKMIARFLSAKELANIKDDLMKKKSANNNVTIATLQRNLKDTNDKAKHGNVGEINDKFVLSTLSKLESLTNEETHYNRDAYQRDAIETAATITTANAIKKMAMVPASQKQELDKKIEAVAVDVMNGVNVPEESRTQFAAGIRESLKDYKDKAWAGLIKKRNDDPAAAVVEARGFDGLDKLFASTAGGLSNNVEMNEQYFNKSEQAQNFLEISKANQRLLTDERSKSIVSELENEKNAATAAAKIMNYNKNFGSRSPQIFDQLVKDGKLDNKYRMAMYIENQEFATSAIESFKNKDALDSLKKDKAAYKKLQDETSKQFAAHFNSIAGTGPRAINVESANSLKEIVLFSSGVRMQANPDLTEEEAVKFSMDKAIKSSFEVYNGAMVPRRIGSQAINSNLVVAEMKKFENKDYVNSLGIVPPGGLDKSDAQVKQRYENAVNQVVSGRKRWVHNPEMTESRLEVYLKDRDVWIPVSTKDGIISVDYLKATVKTSKEALEEAAPITVKIRKKLTGK